MLAARLRQPTKSVEKDALIKKHLIPVFDVQLGYIVTSIAARLDKQPFETFVARGFISN